MVIKDAIKEYIKQHSLEESPKECCGLLYVPPQEFEPKAIRCENEAENKCNFFAINPKDYLKVSLMGKIVAFYHSHSETPYFSDFDKINAENFKLEALMYCVKQDSFHEYRPIGYELPFVNRQYVVGFIDCFSLVRDYYIKNFNINITELNHSYRFVEDKKNHPENNKVHNILVDHFKENEFFEVKNLKHNDLILTKTNTIESPTHVSIYIEKDQVLHHPYKKLSILEPYRTVLKHWTTHFLRHKKLT